MDYVSIDSHKNYEWPLAVFRSAKNEIEPRRGAALA